MNKLTVDPSTEQQRNETLLYKLGIKTPNMPVDESHDLPTNLADLTSDELHNLHSLYTAWLVYTAYEETKKKVEVSILRSRLEYEGAKAYVMTEGHRVTDKREAKLLSDDVIEIQNKLLVAETSYAILRSVRKMYESYIFAVSRRLSTLQSERASYGG